MADDVFDHDYRAVHDHAKIERAEREKIRGNLRQIEADGGEQQGKRDGERDNEGGAHVAEEKKKDDGNEEKAFGEIVQHGMRSELDENAAVKKRDDLDAGREDTVVEFLNLGVNAHESLIGIGAFPEQDDAFDDIAIVNNFSVFAVDGLE